MKTNLVEVAMAELKIAAARARFREEYGKYLRGEQTWEEFAEIIGAIK